MSYDAILVLVILLGAVMLFVTEKLSIDMVAILVLGVVMAAGLVTPQEAISGFSNPATVTVAAVFVLSAGLQRTGVLRALGRTLFQVGNRPLILMVVITITIGAISAFINNTAAVAVFLPLVLTLAARLKMSASKLLMPMSFASQFGGVCTLIGTSTNLLVSSIAAEHALKFPEVTGLGAFSMFEMGKLGLILCATGIIYLLVVGYWLLPDRKGEQLIEAYELGNYITEFQVMPGSSLIGKSAIESGLGKKYDVRLLEIMREKSKLWAPSNEPISENDVLLVEGQLHNLMESKDSLKLEIAPEFKLKDDLLKGEKSTLAEVMVAPGARVAGKNLRDLDFHSRYDAIVLAIQRQGRPLRHKLNSVRLRFGDLLLVQAPEPAIEKLLPDRDFIVMEEKGKLVVNKSKVPIALGILALVVGLAALNVMPILASAVLGCIAMLLTRCLSLEEAYEAIDWRVIFLLGGMLPLGVAMENTGLARLIAENTVGLVGQFGPGAVLAALFFLTAVLTACMSNNATAVLLAPIAISTAMQMGVSPKPLLLAVAFAASTSFATPIGYQTNMMVYNPGGYRFVDFFKVGLPLTVLFGVVSIYFIPKFWPF